MNLKDQSQNNESTVTENTGAENNIEEGVEKQEQALETDAPTIEEKNHDNSENKEELNTEEAEEASDKEESEEKEEGLQALNDKYLRLYAEFENYRKRTARESLELIQTANAGVIEKLLPVLEDFTRAFAQETKANKLEDFEAGIKMIFNGFKDVLEDAGLEEISPEGEEFDPNLHEALMEQPHDTVEEGHVVQVFQKGYKLKSKILKHAKVIISKGPAQE